MEKRKRGRPKKVEKIDPEAIDPELLLQYNKSVLEKGIESAAKEKEQKELLILKRKQLEKSLISIDCVAEIFTNIAAKAKSEMYRLIQEIPPKAEGLPATQIVPIVEDLVYDILNNLHTNYKDGLERITVDEW